MNTADGFDKLNYAYSFKLNSIAPGNDSTVSLNIDSDSNFQWIKSTYYATSGASAASYSTRPIPLITIQLIDTGSGRRLFDKPIPISNFFGTGELPAMMPLIQEFRKNSTITCEFKNESTTVTYQNIYLSMIGYKVFAK